MGLPLMTAIVGLGVGLSLITLLASVIELNSAGPILATMIGLGVGIDYALFIVTRHRQFLHDGLDVDEAAGRAIATSGSAVVFAGVTVVIAILGLQVGRPPDGDVDGPRRRDHRRGDGGGVDRSAARVARRRRAPHRQPPRPGDRSARRVEGTHTRGPLGRDGRPPPVALTWRRTHRVALPHAPAVQHPPRHGRRRITADVVDAASFLRSARATASGPASTGPSRSRSTSRARSPSCSTS